MKNNNIYVLGSINVDLVISAPIFPKQGETIHGKDFLINSGGKGANQAVAAKKLGANVHLIGAVGNDEFKDIALKVIRSSGVNTESVFVKDAKTGVAMIIKHEGDNRIILDSGSNILISREDLVQGLKGAREGDVFISQFEVNMDVVYEGLKIAKSLKMVTILNPAPAALIKDEAYKDIDYLVINQSEAELLTNIYPKSFEDTKEVFNFFKKKGLKNLIVTLGSKGSVYLGHEVFKTEAYKIITVDTTGAGDSFIGAFAYGLVNDLSPNETLKIANATSALVCLRPGAQRAMPSLNEVEKFIIEKGEENEKETNNY